jgi:phosphatidylinositol-3-phosphatase
MRARLVAIGAGVVTVFGCIAGGQALAHTVPHVASDRVAAVSASRPCVGSHAPNAFRHVIWIWMENNSFGSIIGKNTGAPYINSLANKCGLATNYHNISHPSLPNYMAATSGLGYSGIARFDSDCDPVAPCVNHARSIFAQVVDWRAFEESMPNNCSKSDSGEYAVRHNPPPYYTTLKGCSKFDVPYSRFPGDLSHDRLPTFSFITPNLIDDMHDGTVQDGNNWLSHNVPRILNSREYRKGTVLLIITWDEGEGGTSNNCAVNTKDIGCRVATLVIAPSTRPGTKSAKLFNHYSLLGTTEQLLGLPKLGLAAKSATMIKAFHL